MPGPYDISSGSYIGAIPYSPRSQTALRRLASTNDYEIMGSSDQMPEGMMDYIAARGMNKPIVTSGTARGQATIGGKTYYMGEGGSASETPVGEYDWSRSRKRTINADQIANSNDYRSFVADRTEAARAAREEAKAAADMKRRVEEARSMAQVKKEFEGEDAALNREMLRAQIAAAKAQLERGVRDMNQMRGPEDQRQLGLLNSRAQAAVSQISDLEKSGDPRKIRQAAALRQQFAQNFGGSDVILPGSTITEQDAIRRASAVLAPRIQATVESVVTPLMQREAQANYQRSGPFGGAFTLNTADPLSDQEVGGIRQRLADEAQKLADETGVPAQIIYTEMMNRAKDAANFSSFRDTAIPRHRAEDIIGLLRGSWGDASLPVR